MIDKCYLASRAFVFQDKHLGGGKLTSIACTQTKHAERGQLLNVSVNSVYDRFLKLQCMLVSQLTMFCWLLFSCGENSPAVSGNVWLYDALRLKKTVG